MTEILSFAAELVLVAWLAILASVPVHQMGWIPDPIDATLAAYCVISWVWLCLTIARATPEAVL